MAIPTTAIVWAESMDPYDVLDYEADVTNLLDGSEVASFSVAPTAESLLAGLKVGTAEYAPLLSSKIIRVWFSINNANQGDPLFDGTGATLPVEISVTTNSTPPRKRQRTFVLKVAQR